MGRKRKAKRRPLRPRPIAPDAEKGFDFGEHMTVGTLPTGEFDSALREARVFGCAYGYDTVPGFPHPLPCITLIGENPEGFRRAFDQFSRWGCEDDGDVVGISLLLRLDGSYQIWIGPDPERSMYRLMPHAGLCSPLLMNILWIKQFDSTNPFVRELKAYRRASLSPVLFGAATTDRSDLEAQHIQPIRGIPRPLKFELEIVDQGENQDDLRFQLRDASTRSGRRGGPTPPKPDEYRRQRARTFDVAFPVSRERVSRQRLVSQVRALRGFDSVSEDQVIQAAVNLMLSHELVPGDRHYRAVPSDLSHRIWDHVFSRVELADGKLTPADQAPILVARQLELDVQHVLAQQGVTVTGQKFTQLQAAFRYRGFVDD